MRYGSIVINIISLSAVALYAISKKKINEFISPPHGNYFDSLVKKKKYLIISIWPKI